MRMLRYLNLPREVFLHFPYQELENRKYSVIYLIITTEDMATYLNPILKKRTQQKLLLGSKNLNSSLPLGEVVLTFCLSWASLYLLFYGLVGRQLSCSHAQQASKNEKLLASRKIFLIWMTGQHFFEPRIVCSALL